MKYDRLNLFIIVVFCGFISNNFVFSQTSVKQGVNVEIAEKQLVNGVRGPQQLLYGRRERYNCGNRRIRLDPSESKTITSPKYPNKFETNSNCLWLLRAPRGYRLQLTLEDLVLPSCKHILTIESGYGRPLPIRECGMIIGQQTFLSDYNYLVIKFRAKPYGFREKGFKLTVRAVKTACDINLCQNGGTCLSTKNSFKCLCPKHTSGLLCENKADACFLGSLDVGISVCCTDINGLSKCEAESTCTFIKAGCIFDCSAFSGNSTTCNVVPGCIHVPLLGTCVTVADPM